MQNYFENKRGKFFYRVEKWREKLIKKKKKIVGIKREFSHYVF